jgi:hypothetical protein
MHLGNASFLYEGRLRFRLAPAYDMLPMLYAPLREELPARNFTAPAPTPAAADQWQLALPVAHTFWQTVSAEDRVSEEFRQIAAANAALISPTARAGGSAAV